MQIEENFVNNIVGSEKIAVTKELEKETIEENIIIEEQEEIIEEIEIQEIGTIEIPSINLVAPIAEDTTEIIMNQYVGHFIYTSLWDGNIGLAAHNRGYPVNYFQNVKELQFGDKIIITSEKGRREYSVDMITVIEETNWSYLENTQGNKVTLITCVENEPSYRRCVQASEII